MRFMVWLPLIGDALLAPGLPALARRLQDRRGYQALTLVGVAGTVCWLWCLVLLGTVFADRVGYLGTPHGWAGAPAGVRAVPLLAAAPAAAALLATVLRMTLLGAQHARELVQAERLARLPFGGEVIELPDEEPHACAVGGLTGGRIAISRGLRRCLTDDEQSAVLAHERAHLTGHHHWYRMAAAWCAAVCPLFYRLPTLIEHSCERTADEAAALAIGDRRLLARALGKAALAATRARRAASEPALLHGGVPERMAALLDEPRPAGRSPIASAILYTAAISAMLLAAVHASTDCAALLCP